jgi:ABC-type uncharacterized transport system permease subunit
MEPYVSASLTFLFTVLTAICIVAAGLLMDKVRYAIAGVVGWVVFGTLLVGVWTYIGSTTPDCRNWLWLLVVGAIALNIAAVWWLWKTGDS